MFLSSKTNKASLRKRPDAICIIFDLDFFVGAPYPPQNKPLVDQHVSVIQSRYSNHDIPDELNILDKPHRKGMFNSGSPASCHSPRHGGE